MTTARSFFEWYKYVGLVSNLIKSIIRASPAARPAAPSHFGVLIALSWYGTPQEFEYYD